MNAGIMTFLAILEYFVDEVALIQMRMRLEKLGIAL